MFALHKYKTASLLIIFTFLANACGASPEVQSEISTAVAQTVQAGDSQTETAPPTITPEINLSAEQTLTPAFTETPATASSSSAPQNCTTSAELLGENPPDEAIFKPGETFLKTWHLKNTGTCTWNSNYSLIYWDGERMDGYTSYAFYEEVPSGGEMSISVSLRAPAETGNHIGYWRLQTPWKTNFGVEPVDNAIYVEVIVSTAKHPIYGITNVEFSLVRNPAKGCATTVEYTTYAKISTDGPLEVSYYWFPSGGDETGVKTIVFDAAETKTISYSRLIARLADKATPWWVDLRVVAPVGYSYDEVIINHRCD